jgi:exodeoxyribonuclease VII large subunit
MPDSAGNTPEFSVSELSSALKRTVEDAFGFVRVRGELGRVTVAKSGHVYFDLKDQNAVLGAVMWKGVASGLGFRPEEGLEVVASGKLSTFPGQSKYQLIAERMEPAGVGALLAQLEKLKARLAAEGLFAAERKRPLPYLPAVVGVITSPTGAVIRDILHRLSERFPRRVILWPTLVQGERAAGEVARAIAGFNALPEGGSIPRPDVLIVARGGGSIEDLWAFNEEIVVRAAAASAIPLISAVGHETDTTLIDFAADLRAPTPTGAAEKAVPVRAELLAQTATLQGRLGRAMARTLDGDGVRLRAAAGRLPRPEALFSPQQQRLDLADARLAPGLRALAAAKDSAFQRLAGRLRGPMLIADVERRASRLTELWGRAGGALARRRALEATTLSRQESMLNQTSLRLAAARLRAIDRAQERLEALAGRLEALNPDAVLSRGYAIVRDRTGRVVNAARATPGLALTLRFADGEAKATVDGGKPVQGSLF